MLLQIEHREIEPDITVMELTGKMALGRESQRIESLVADLTASNRRKIIMDMTRVDYLDSAGVGLIALSGGKLKKAGAKLVLVVGKGRVLDLLEMTQVHQIVPVYATIEEARGSFGETYPATA